MEGCTTCMLHADLRLLGPLYQITGTLVLDYWEPPIRLRMGGGGALTAVML